ncbi:hypothetical protein STCU_08112 [Strigomonas culicis]|uniref:Thioredoxin-like fold domain-containing protein n=1 Tax=Strigomonas culicis TaxID=28005 RepID=S9VI00_9TRYP|nr:hypothetical protein STCU_08112 [Strigomonas culicis]|eukprot:EPY22820.1 hypothetical protein STCU_08112 [Strigomonas culicis]
MLRLRAALRQRTSRKGPGTWSHPRIASQAASRQAGPVGYDAADNPRMAGGEPPSWRADPRRVGRPIQADPFQHSVRGAAQAAPGPHLQRAAGSGDTHYAEDKSWTGGAHRINMERERGRKVDIDDFSMVDREHMTVTSVLRAMVQAAYKPKDSDSRTFGGDGSTYRSELKEELKSLDHRVVPFFHDDVMNDNLKNIMGLHTPSGQKVSRDVLKGRLVGLLFFTESERSRSFMLRLRPFHRAHTPDLVVVAVSLASKEMRDVTRANGFYHCTHRDGGGWVARDAGISVRPFAPMPRLLIVDGTTGLEVTRSGLTAVLTHPETCFDEWKRGYAGCEMMDHVRSLFLL